MKANTHSPVFVLVFFLASLILHIHAFLNVEELKNIRYGIDILNVPVVLPLDETELPSNTVLVSSKYGQQYKCSFPDKEQHEKNAEEEEKLAKETGIPELLKPLESAACLVKNKDWWTYEFCYGRHIRQYHVEDAKIASSILYLGHFDSDYEWDKEENGEDGQHDRNFLNRYHSQNYVNGSKCDITGGKRQTEARFVCEEGSGDYITRIDEPETCKYIMTIHTYRICHHPYLKPPTKQKPVPIVCNPLVSVEQYEEYQIQIEASKKTVPVLKDGDRKTDESESIVEEDQTKEDSTHSKHSHIQNKDNLSVMKNNLKSSLLEDQFEDIVKEAETELAEEGIDVKVIETGPAFKQLSDSLNKLLKKLDRTDKEIADTDKELEKLTEDINELKREKVLDDINESKGENAEDMPESKIEKLTEDMPVSKSEKLTDDMPESKSEKQTEDMPESKSEKQTEDMNESEGKKLTEGMNESEGEKLIEDVNETEDEKQTDHINESEDDFEDDKIKVKITKIASGDMIQEGTEVEDEQTKRLEEAVQKGLEKAGLETGGQKIQVKIITAGYYDPNDKELHLLSDDDTDSFQNMIVAILGGNNEAAEEEKNQKSLQDNYNFVWKPSSKKNNNLEFEKDKEDL